MTLEEIKNKLVEWGVPAERIYINEEINYISISKSVTITFYSLSKRYKFELFGTFECDDNICDFYDFFGYFCDNETPDYFCHIGDFLDDHPSEWELPSLIEQYINL